MSVDQPRSDKWAEWYTFHPNVLASYREVTGAAPLHEAGCTFDPAPELDPDPKVLCWCNAFCGYCDHHSDHHEWRVAKGEKVPCTHCPEGVCPG